MGQVRQLESWTSASWNGTTAEETTLSNLHKWEDATLEAKKLAMRIGGALLRVVKVWTEMGDNATHRNGRLQLLQSSAMEIDGIAWKARGRMSLEAADLLTKLALRMEESKRLDTVMDEVMHNLDERVKEGMIDGERSEFWKERGRTATFQRRLGMATNAMVASQWPTENSMSVQDQMQRMLTEYAQTAAAIVMKAVIALKRGVNTEEDAIAVDDCYHHMDDMIEELGGELVEWTDWYGILADEIEGRAEAEAAEERERERVSIAVAAEKERVRWEEVRRQEAHKQEVMAERAKPTLNITFYIKNEGKGKGGGKGKGKKGREGEREGEERRNGTNELDRGKQPVAATGTGRKRDGIHAGGTVWENETPVEAFTRQAVEKIMERALIWDEGEEDEDRATGSVSGKGQRMDSVERTWERERRRSSGDESPGRRIGARNDKIHEQGNPKEGGGSGVLPREEAPADVGIDGLLREGGDWGQTATTARGLGWGRGEKAAEGRGGGPVGVRGGLRATDWDSTCPRSREPIQ